MHSSGAGLMWLRGLVRLWVGAINWGYWVRWGWE